jgi:hypothetical protein
VRIPTNRGERYVASVRNTVVLCTSIALFVCTNWRRIATGTIIRMQGITIEETTERGITQEIET